MNEMSKRGTEERKITHTQETFDDLPEAPGAYELILSGYTVYVGHTMNIRQRIKEYGACPDSLDGIIFHPAKNRIEAEREAERVIRGWGPRRPRISIPEN
jgi:hypothetical protein